ncbi:MAG: helix-hairpin-helix domain-containing protein [bacterium]
MPIPLTPTERRLARLLTAGIFIGLTWNVAADLRPAPPPVRLIRGALAADSTATDSEETLHAEDARYVSRPGDPLGSRPEGPVDLLTAGPAELEQLPGVGPVIAARIAAWREERTSPWRLEDLLEVRGIGPATLERLRAYQEAVERSAADSAGGGG